MKRNNICLQVITRIDLTGTDFCHQYVFRWKHTFDPQLYKAHESLLMDADVLLSMWRVSMLDIKEPCGLTPAREKERRTAAHRNCCGLRTLSCQYLFTCLFTFL